MASSRTEPVAGWVQTPSPQVAQSWGQDWRFSTPDEQTLSPQVAQSWGQEMAFSMPGVQ
jgi:hypothetical protein